MIEKAEEKSQVEPVSDEDVENSYEVPATYVNRFFVTVGLNTRITFSEQRSPDKKVHLRGAIVMTHQDAISLWKVLQKVLAPIEEAIKHEIASELTEKSGKDG